MSLRARLAIGYSFVFCLALILLGAALYQVLRGALFDEVDRALRGRALQLERTSQSRGDELNTSQLGNDILVLTAGDPGEELETPGLMARVYDLSGLTLAVSSGVARQLPNNQ